MNVAAPSAMINAGGQWNTFEIQAQGSELIVNLNGTQTVATNDDQHPSGPFALQYAARHGQISQRPDSVARLRDRRRRKPPPGS